MPTLRYGFLAAALFTLGSRVALAAPHGSPLPLKKVRLYEVGVAYFERTGSLKQGQRIELPVPAANLDDALKTLVVLTPGGKASVSAVEFPSRVSRDMAQALSGLAATPDANGTDGLFASLRGARVEVRAKTGSFAGRLISVTPPTSKACDDKESAPEDTKACRDERSGSFTLLTDQGELRQIARNEVTALKPLDPSSAVRIGSAADALFAGSARESENLVLRATGNAPITLGYVAQAPLWRSTYRLVFGQEAAVLQGWALVHNDSDEDWRGVKVELANGQPDSYLFPLAAPRYVSRRLEDPGDGSSTVPQLFDTTVDNLVDAYGAGGLGLSGIGEGGGGRGEGIGLGSVGTIGHGAGAGSGDSASSLLDVGNLAAAAQADGVEAGALFTYSLTSPVDLKARSSALLPFLQSKLTAQRIAWFRAAGEPAESGAHLTNESLQTLPPGTVSIFADGGFAGESRLKRLKPKESQILRFGVDLDVNIDLESDPTRDESRLLSFNRAILVEHFARHHHMRFSLENRSASGRRVYVGLDVVNNSKIEGGAMDSGYDVDQGRAWAAFDIGPREEKSPALDVEEGLSRGYELDSLEPATLKALSQRTTLPAPQRKILERALEALVGAERFRVSIANLKAERDRLNEDAERYRSDLQAIGPKGEGSDKIVTRLLAAEDRERALARKADGAALSLGLARAHVAEILATLGK